MIKPQNCDTAISSVFSYDSGRSLICTNEEILLKWARADCGNQLRIII